MTNDTSTLREARRAAGLSQVALADAAGVSRQAVGAIESGLHRPGVDAAMAIAAAVGSSVEQLFADSQVLPATPMFGTTEDGSAVLAARIGNHLVYAPTARTLASEGWPVANAMLQHGRPVALPGADLDGLIVVGCDPALGLAAALGPATGARHVIALSGSTAAALRLMQEDRAHAALVHGPAGALPDAPAGTLRIHLARWRVGVASRGRRPRSVDELCSEGVRVVQREDGASIQKAFLAAVRAAGHDPPDGPLARGHLEVARRITLGARAGVTMEPAALGHDLAFTAVEEHVAEIWIDRRWRTHPGVDALGGILRTSAFTTRLSLVGGYELADCGTQLTVAA